MLRGAVILIFVLGFLGAYIYTIGNKAKAQEKKEEERAARQNNLQMQVKP